MMVIYGSIANVSIAQLFLAGFVPGVAMGLGLMGVLYIAKKHNYPASPERTAVNLAFVPQCCNCY